MKVMLAFDAFASGFNAALLLIPGYQALNAACAVFSAAVAIPLACTMRGGAA